MRKLAKNLHAEIDIGGVVQVVIAIVVAAILLAALLPNTIQNNTRNVITTGASAGNQSVGAVNTNNWSNVAGLGSTWDSIPVIEVLAALMIFVLIAMRLMKG